MKDDRTRLAIKRISLSYSCPSDKSAEDFSNFISKHMKLDQLLIDLPIEISTGWAWDYVYYLGRIASFTRLLAQGSVRKLSFVSSTPMDGIQSTLDIDPLFSFVVELSALCQDNHDHSREWYLNLYIWYLRRLVSRTSKQSPHISRSISILLKRLIETREDDPSQCVRYHSLKDARSILSLTCNPA